MADRVRIARARQAQMRAQQSQGGRFENLSQLNRGIAQTVGGAVDLINPLDPWTGSAEDGITALMEAIGVEVADQPPQGILQGAFRGVGNALGGAIPAAGVANAAGRFGGAVGAAGQEAYRQLTTRGGLALESVSGAGAGSAETAVRESGGGSLAQAAAALAAGAAAPAAAVSAPGAARAAAMATPVMGRAIRGARGAVTPYTREGALNVARKRVQALAGGEDRAAELAKRIRDNDPLTPAQQTEDAAMIGLERAVREADPVLGDRLQERDTANLNAVRNDGRSFGGQSSIADTRAGVEARREAFKTRLESRVAEARQRADQRIASIQPERTETDNSMIVADEIRKSLREAQEIEARLWARVPMQESVPTELSRATVADIIAQTPRAQMKDIPEAALRFLGREGEFGDQETVREMHGLYSALREDARNAMAGTNQQKNRARIANSVADAILEDMGQDQSTEVGRILASARDYSRELHETFDQGAVGKLLRRTLQSDEQIPPELTLDRTVARGGAAADTAFSDIQKAVGNINDVDLQMRGAVEDYLRRRFSDQAFTSDGQFSERGARSFVRNNEQLLARFPELRKQFNVATTSRVDAEALARRSDNRARAANNRRSSEGARFVESPEGREVETILSARDPARAAREVVRQARRGGGEQAVSGLKGDFARYLIERATGRENISAVNMREMLRDPRSLSALRQVFDQNEMGRLRTIADRLAKLEASQAGGVDVGGVSNVEPPKLISFVLRTFAARQGAKAGQGTSGASLLTANFASRRMQEIIDGLTNDRAARLIAEAVENPKLFRALLTDPASVKQSQRALRSLAPYVAGAVSAATEDE